MQETDRDIAVRHFVHALERLERQKGQGATIQEVVQTMVGLPITAGGIADLIRAVYHDGIAYTGTSPNPTDYNRPVIHVYLNREHPTVRATLAGEPLPKHERRIGSDENDFEPVAIRGEPASVTLIRERR